MKRLGSITGWLMLLALAAVQLESPAAFGQGTAFTYQGCLSANGSPATGIYDLEFTVCDAVAGGNNIAGPLTNTATAVTNGLFTVTLDFGGVFNGSNCWLEIAARGSGDAGFTTLAPRQALTPAPYAIYAASAASLSGVLPGAGLSGTYSNALTLTNTANQFGGSFAGNGSGLSNLPAANLSGIIPPSSLGLAPNAFVTNAVGQIIATNADMSVNLGNLPNLTRALASNVPPRFLWFGDSTGNYTLPSLQTWLQNYSANHAIQLSGPFWGGPYWCPQPNVTLESEPNYYWYPNGCSLINAGTTTIWGTSAGPCHLHYAPGNQIQIWMEASASNGVASLYYGPDGVNWTNLGSLDEAALGAEGILVVTNFSVPLGNYAIKLACTAGAFRWVGNVGVIQTNSTFPIFYDMHAPGLSLWSWTNMGKNAGVILSNINPCVTFYEQTKPFQTFSGYAGFASAMSNDAPGSDVVLISSYQTPPNLETLDWPTNNTWQMALFEQAVAITNHWNFVDVWTPLGSWSNIVALGLNLDAVIHLNSQGQDFVSQMVMQKLGLPAIWQEAQQAANPLTVNGDLAVNSPDYVGASAQFGSVANYSPVIGFGGGGVANGDWSLGAYTASGYWTILKGLNGIYFTTSSGAPYGTLWQDGGWSFLDGWHDPHRGVDPGGPGVLLANTTTNYNLSFAGNGFASGATTVKTNITAATWVNTNSVNGSIWVSAATNLAFFNSAGVLVFGPVSVTNAAFPVGPGWTVTNSAATFNFSAF